LSFFDWSGKKVIESFEPEQGQDGRPDKSGDSPENQRRIPDFEQSEKNIDSHWGSHQDYGQWPGSYSRPNSQTERRINQDTHEKSRIYSDTATANCQLMAAQEIASFRPLVA
jgi:hypothetical protein